MMKRVTIAGLALVAFLLVGSAAFAQSTTTSTSSSTSTSSTSSTTTSTVPDGLAWAVVTPQSCTGVGTPAPCCESADSPSNERCNLRHTAGHLTAIEATFAVTLGGQYTSGGDAITAGQFAKLGLNRVMKAQCGPVLSSVKAGFPVSMVIGTSGASLKAKLYNLELGSGLTPAELADNSPLSVNSYFECTLLGR